MRGDCCSLQVDSVRLSHRLSRLNPMLRGDFDIVGDDLGDSVVAELFVLLSPWLALACLIIWDARDRPREAVPMPEVEPKAVSSDFAALIHTMQREGRAYRREEQREDRGKNIREWITIALIALTFVAVCYQVHEMIKVYEPIKEQAEATKQAADASTRAADASTKQSEIATVQSEKSERGDRPSAACMGWPYHC